MEEYLAALSAVPALTGHEPLHAPGLLEVLQGAGLTGCFADPLGNVGGFLPKGEGPLVMLLAHIDEVGLMVTGVEPGGFLRVRRISIDPRVLPGQTVWVWGREPLPGVIGLPASRFDGEWETAVTMEELFVDLGLPEERVRALVSLGDRVTFPDRLTPLEGERRAGRALDDRLGAALLLETAKLLAGEALGVRALLALTAQEERASQGALALARRWQPALAVAVDATHARGPGAERGCHGLERLVLALGPQVHAGVFRRLRNAAERLNIPYDVAVEPGDSGTDATGLQLAEVPTGILQLPLRHMHTPAEVGDLDTARRGAALLAEFLRTTGKGEEPCC